ncbi:O-linked N-acetylglucosamine transferase, SPINDLY family protein [Azospirillum sp. sgz301742]
MNRDALTSLLERARALYRADRLDEAEALVRSARVRFETSPAVHTLLGNIVLTRGRTEEARQHFQRAVALLPSHAEMMHNLGTVLKRLGRLDKAGDGFARAAAAKPELADAHRSAAEVQQAFGRTDAAIARLKRVVALMPEDPRTYLSLGLLLKARDERGGSVPAFRRASLLDPGNTVARLGLCMANLPVLYDRTEELPAARASYRQELLALAQDIRLDTPAAIAAAADSFGSFQPYYLAYQEMPDRDLQEIYGGLACRVMAARYPQWATRPPMPPVEPGRPLRIGIVSGFFRWHTIWKLFIRGWMEGLDRSRFELHGYYTGSVRDACTAAAKRGFDRFTEHSGDFEAMCRRLREDRLHAVIFPEIGMDSMAARLAMLRHAPLQCVSWGHPDTTGMPTIDAFLTSDLMEPAGAEAHYSEELVHMPNLGIRYAELPVAPEPLDLVACGVRPEATVYLCCQYLSKYLPQHDDIFARIAAEVPDSQFLFINPRSDGLTARLRRRLDAAFAARGLDAARHVVILPYLSPGQYAQLNHRAHIYLDSIGWSGGNTTMEAVAAGLPVVTLPGALMRGRHSAAILQALGVTDTIAAGEDAFVAIAARLAHDVAWRRGLSSRIREAQPRLHDDTSPVRALEAFLEGRVAALAAAG